MPPFFVGRGIDAGHLVRRDFFKKVLFFDRQQWILDLTNHGQDKKQDPRAAFYGVEVRSEDTA